MVDVEMKLDKRGKKSVYNENKQVHIRIINTRLGLFIPRITTPMMLFREEV